MAELIAEQKKAEARPLRWALKQLYYRYAIAVFSGLVLTIAASIVWIKKKALGSVCPI